MLFYHISPSTTCITDVPVDSSVCLSRYTDDVSVSRLSELSQLTSITSSHSTSSDQLCKLLGRCSVKQYSMVCRYPGFPPQTSRFSLPSKKSASVLFWPDVDSQFDSILLPLFLLAAFPWFSRGLPKANFKHGPRMISWIFSNFCLFLLAALVTDTIYK